MLAFISPATGCNAQIPQGTTKPSRLSKTGQIISCLQGLNLTQLQKLPGCSDARHRRLGLTIRPFGGS